MLFSTWTIVIMSSASSRVRTLKIPKMLAYFFSIAFLVLGSALFFTYQHSQSLFQHNQALASELEQNETVYKDLEEKHQSLLKHAQDTESKINQLVKIEKDMNQLVTGNGIGGEEIQINQLSLTKENNKQTDQKNATKAPDPEINHYQTIQQSLPELVQQYNETIKELKSVQEEIASIPSIWPTNQRRITSTFGERDDPFTSNPAIHYALDIAGPYRSPIYATADGVVSFAGRDGGYGNLVEITHSSEYKTRYGHMTKILVKNGQKVKKGDQIGEMGTTGRSTGVHVHYEVIKNGKRVDPLPYIMIDDK